MSEAMTFTYDAGGFDESAPVIYLWMVVWPDGRTDSYVGQSKSGANRPLKHYKRNVKRFNAGRPYRKSNPDGWRRVHLAMAECMVAGGAIHLSLIANTSHSDINALERHYIRELRPSLNGGDS